MSGKLEISLLKMSYLFGRNSKTASEAKKPILNSLHAVGHDGFQFTSHTALFLNLSTSTPTRTS
jgi:hypothetical protein